MMSLLWKGACRIYFDAYTEAPLFWSVDDGDSATVIKCPRVVRAGSFETVVAPEQNVQPRAWLSFKKASVYKQKDGIIVVIDWTTASLRNRELYGTLQGTLDDNDMPFLYEACLNPEALYRQPGS